MYIYSDSLKLTLVVESRLAANFGEPFRRHFWGTVSPPILGSCFATNFGKPFGRQFQGIVSSPILGNRFAASFGELFRHQFRGTVWPPISRKYKEISKNIYKHQYINRK